MNANLIVTRLMSILVVSLFGILLTSMGGFASGINVTITSDKDSVSVVTSDHVKIVRASVSEDADGIRITGALQKLRDIRGYGHLHVTLYRANGNMISESDHLVHSMRFRNGNGARVPFNILLDSVSEDVARVSLKYHR